MSAPSRWDDLVPRILSAIAMVVVGGFCVWQGGLPFRALMVAVCGLMVWELDAMLDRDTPRKARVLGVVAALALAVSFWTPAISALPVLMIPVVLGAAWVARGRATHAVYAAIIMLAGYGLVSLRDGAGLTWVAWLILVVAVTDIAGYFAGRLIGGPKLWPRVSPKKTWSGTVAGWLAAALVGAAMASVTGAGGALALVSVLVSMASQAGDIAESAIKRRCGVKDSSSLIPGHGGLLDRFDGMLGAAVLVLLASQIAGFPPVTP